MVRSSRLRLVLILLTAVLVALGGSVPTATASPPAPPETGSAAGHADSPMTVAPPPGPATRARAAAAPQAPPPDEMSEEAEADKAKAEAGFRSPNQKPIATELGTPARPAAAAQAAPAGPQTLATAFPGVTDTGFQPPDTIMAAGPNNVVVAVNAEVAVYSKVGTQLSVQSLADVFSSQGQAAQDGLFDPQVVYDRYIDRFWLTAISKHENPNRSSMLIAVSQTSDATDGWRTTAIDAGVTGNDATGNWCDRDSLGFDTQAIYVSCDMFAFPADSHVFKGAKIRVMTKGQFLAGPCCSWWDFANLGGVRDTFSIRPARMLGATDADGEYLVNATGGGGEDDTLRVWHITNPGNCCRDNPSAPDITFSFQQVGVFQPAPDVRQQGTSATLDPDGTRLQYAFWQGGHLSTGQNLACPDVNAACVAYTELDVTKYPDMSVVNDFVLNQSDPVDRFYPAVDANDAGDKGDGLQHVRTEPFRRHVVRAHPAQHDLHELRQLRDLDRGRPRSLRRLRQATMGRLQRGVGRSGRRRGLGLW